MAYLPKECNQYFENDHFGHTVQFRERYEGEAPNGAGKPTNGAFVEMLAEHLRQKYYTDNEN